MAFSVSVYAVENKLLAFFLYRWLLYLSPSILIPVNKGEDSRSATDQTKPDSVLPDPLPPACPKQQKKCKKKARHSNRPDPIFFLLPLIVEAAALAISNPT